MKSVLHQRFDQAALCLNGIIVAAALVTFAAWFFGPGFFYSEHGPVMSPFTSLSLLLLAGSRLADRLFDTWSKPMTLAILGIVSCGNISSILMLLILPDLLVVSMPQIVSTSIMTSTGIVLFCFYDIFVTIRKTPQSAIIVDDILLHLALFPGGLSLLGHLLDVPAYISTSIDPRVGIGLLEMAFMGSYAVVAVSSNPNLFLWRFLTKSLHNRIIFAALFLNQYVAPVLVGLSLHDPSVTPRRPGIELFVMLAGVLATLTFLVILSLS